MGSAGKSLHGGFIRGFEASTQDGQAGGTNTWILSHNKAFQVFHVWKNGFLYKVLLLITLEKSDRMASAKLPSNLQILFRF